MTQFKKALLGAATLLALSAPVAYAGSINVGGVVFEPGVTNQFDSGSFAQIFDTTTGNLSGWGFIDSFNNDPYTEICPGCELTYSFSNFLIDEAQSSLSRLAFTGGEISLYVDSPGNFSISNGTTASDGALWMQLTGHVFLDLLGASLTTGTTSASLTSGNFMMDVKPLGLPVEPYFDTNTIPDFLGGYADFQGSSSVVNYYLNGLNNSPIPSATFVEQVAIDAGAAGFGFTDPTVNVTSFFKNNMGLDQVIATGSQDIVGATQPIPEPASLALLGIGLAGLGGTALRRNKSKR